MIAREIERAGVPVALITAMTILGKRIGANRVVAGNRITNPCGDPNLLAEADLTLRREIVDTALGVLQIDVDGPTIFEPGRVRGTKEAS